MAGSYRHCEKTEGQGDWNEDFTDMIENLGDAYEACHMMFFMIQYLAEWINDSDWRPDRSRDTIIQIAEEEYYEVSRGEKPNPYWEES